MLANGPDALRADFQRFYGLDLDCLGGTLRVGRVADLAANLPPDAMVWRRLDPRLEWPAWVQLLANMSDRLDFIAWTKSEAGAKRGARWDNAIHRPGFDRTPTTTRQQASHRPREAGVVALPIPELLARLNAPRGATE